MSNPTKNAPAAVGAAAGAENNTLTNQIRSGSLTTIDPKAACRHCTVPVDSGDVCNFCASYTPPACPHNHPLECDCPCAVLDDAIEARALLVEADQHLTADPVPALVASRFADASAAFPIVAGARVYCEAEGSRIYITVHTPAIEPGKPRRETVTEYVAQVVAR